MEFVSCLKILFYNLVLVFRQKKKYKIYFHLSVYIQNWVSILYINRCVFHKTFWNINLIKNAEESFAT